MSGPLDDLLKEVKTQKLQDRLLRRAIIAAGVRAQEAGVRWDNDARDFVPADGIADEDVASVATKIDQQLEAIALAELEDGK